MNTRTPIIVTSFVCLLIAIFIAASGCREQPSTAPVATAPAEAPRARVVAIKPERKTIRRTVTQPGQIEAFEQAKLYAKIPAYVEKYLVDIGDEVTGPRWDANGNVSQPGQLLAELSAPELNVELQQKQALVAQAGANVEQAQEAVKVSQAAENSSAAQLKEAIAAIGRVEAEYERWSLEHNRMVQLVSKSAVNQKIADETKAQMAAADAARNEAQAKIESARSNLAASQAQVQKSLADVTAIRAQRQVAEADEARTLAMLNYLKIEAPFDGKISQRDADIGFFAQSGGGNRTQPLFTVVRTDRVRVFVDLPEMDAPLAGDGDQAIVRVQALSGRDFTGQITRTAWALDPNTRTLRTEVDVANTTGELRPGMYAQVAIVLAERPDALVVPVAAVVLQENQASCFVVKNNKALRKLVVLGIKSGSEVEIVSGLQEDDLVVQSKGASLTDGQDVELTETTPAR